MRWPVLLLLCGCDHAQCTQEVGLRIDVAAKVTADLDPAAPGVQTPVTVATTFAPGDVVTLSVDGAATTATVDVAGVADFGLVTVPRPTAALRATAATACGAADVSTTIEVIAGATCGLAFAAPGDTIARYAPLGVYNIANDADPAMPGEQQAMTVTAFAGAQIELRERSGFGEESMATFVSTGTDTVAITLREGGVSLYARCSDGPIQLTSPSISAFVDSIAPHCFAGTSFNAPPTTTAYAETSDDDSEGELPTLVINHAMADAGPIQNHRSYGSVPYTSETVSLSATVTDHAGNTCHYESEQ